jgi:hypothetical protein
MALLFFDGFEGVAQVLTSNAGSTIGLRYDNVFSSATVAVAASVSPTAPSAAFLSSTVGGVTQQSLVTKNAAAHVSGVVGFSYLLGSDSSPSYTAPAAGHVLGLRDGTTSHLTVRVLSDGAIEVRRGLVGGTVLGTSAAGAVPGTTWCYVECKYVIDDTNGGVWLRVNGTDVLRLGAYAVSPTTLDTRNAASAQVTNYQLGAATQNGFVTAFDNCYWCDLTGPAPFNDFLGDVRVLELLPDGAGDSTQFTPNTGTNHAANDETPGHDGDTTYVASDTGGHRDTYTLTNPSTGSEIVAAVKTVVVARKSEAGDRALTIGVKSGSATDLGSVGNLTDSYAEYSRTTLLDPATTAQWQTAAVDDLLVAIEVPA